MASLSLWMAIKRKVPTKRIAICLAVAMESLGYEVIGFPKGE